MGHLASADCLLQCHQTLSCWPTDPPILQKLPSIFLIEKVMEAIYTIAIREGERIDGGK
jgi:hypothetical protein